MLRQPAVAGYFYKGTAEALRREVGSFIVPGRERVQALGILAPHAGFLYSGPVAGAVYSRVVLPDTFVLIGPNHTGLGAPVSIMAAGAWETPLGAVEIDTDLASAVMRRSPLVHEDSLAHLREHSLEVQLPFIQYFKNDFRIVPIQMLDVRLETCVSVGRAVAAAVRERRTASGGDRGVLVVASSDMSHYEDARAAREKDEKALGRLLDLDPEGLLRTVREWGITMCGYGPAAAMLIACKELGAQRAEMVKYANSGDASGDYDKVVGYAGVLIM